MTRWVILCLLCVTVNFKCGAVKVPYRFKSPSGTVELSFSLVQGAISYTVEFKGSAIIEKGSLGLTFKELDLNSFKNCKVTTSVVDERWKTVWGQKDSIRNHYQEARVVLRSSDNNSLIIWFRIYDDGFAFRYQVPKQKNVTTLQLTSENSSFSIPQIEKCWWSWADYNTLEKTFYSTVLDSASHVACPFTLKRTDGRYLSIHEAAIRDYSTMTLKKTGENSFKTGLVPWQDGVLVKATDSLTSPWRAFLFGETSGDLITNDLILNLNEPCAINDVSWIEPMTYCGVWWEMHLGISTWEMGPRHGATTENAKRYIDFAAENGIKGVLLEGWNTGWENWGKKEAFDFVTPYPDLDLREVVLYAHSKGIEIIGHHETGGDTETYEKLVEKAFQFYKEMGIRAVKTGYAGPVTPEGEYHHGQCMVRHYNRIMELAAKYQLMLDVHEPIVLSGLSRTYPNLMTAEGVRGMEWNAWSDGNPPSHTCTLPFTRGIAGPIDYTPGIVDIDLSEHETDRKKWNVIHTGKTAVHSTIVNQFALLIVLYSPLQMLADLPENYKGHPAMELIRQLPTTWDETRVIASEIGEYIYIARRSGTTWFVAGITNESGRMCDLTFDFLTEGYTYFTSCLTDKEKAHYETNPEAYFLRAHFLKSEDHLPIQLAPGGGFFLRMERIR